MKHDLYFLRVQCLIYASHGGGKSVSRLMSFKINLPQSDDVTVRVTMMERDAVRPDVEPLNRKE